MLKNLALIAILVFSIGCTRSDILCEKFNFPRGVDIHFYTDLRARHSSTNIQIELDEDFRRENYTEYARILTIQLISFEGEVYELCDIENAGTRNWIRVDFSKSIPMGTRISEVRLRTVSELSGKQMLLWNGYYF